jgi:Phage integrase family
VTPNNNLRAFYVSTGARASELLSATRGDVDPGRQVIAVVRKGTRAMQELPASTDAFVWLRLDQVETDGLVPKGKRQPLWWTSRTPLRPLTYHAAHQMFERAAQRAGSSATLHAFRHTAAYRMAEDPALPLTDVQFVLGHALLTTTQIYLPDAPQGGSDPLGTGPSRGADSAGRRTGAAGSCSRVSARDASGAVREPNTMTEPDVLNEAVTFPGVSSRPSKAQRESARTRFPPRPMVTDWPATRHDRGAVWERLTSRMFVLDNANSQDRRIRGLAWLLDWLADQAGETWQQRWMASGADAASGAWRGLPIAWQQACGRESRWLRAELSGALLSAEFAGAGNLAGTGCATTPVIFHMVGELDIEDIHSAAVDEVFTAGEVCGVVGCKEHDDLRDVVDCGEAAKRRHLPSQLV